MSGDDPPTIIDRRRPGPPGDGDGEPDGHDNSRRPGAPEPRRERPRLSRDDKRPSDYHKKRPDPPRPSATSEDRAERYRLERERDRVDSSYRKSGRDLYLEKGRDALVAGILSAAFSGLGQIYNGRWLRGLLFMGIPALLLLIATLWPGGLTHLVCAGSGALTATLGVNIFAAVFGWLPLTHAAFWMGLPIKIAVVGDAMWDAFRAKILRTQRPPIKPWVPYVFIGLGALLLLLWMFTLGLASIPSGAMNPRLEPGDRVMIDRTAYGLQIPLLGWTIGGASVKRGDVVALLHPKTGDVIIRRVVAIPGDRVAFGPRLGTNRRRQPMFARGGKKDPELVDWKPWKGPCVYALRRPEAKRIHRYARCEGHIETIGKQEYLVSYPLQPNEFTKPAPKAGTVPKDKVYVLADNRGAGHDSRHWGPIDITDIRGKPIVILWSRDKLEGIRWQRVGSSLSEPSSPR